MIVRRGIDHASGNIIAFQFRNRGRMLGGASVIVYLYIAYTLYLSIDI